MKLLFITSTRIGDSVLSTALLSHLIDKYPEADITIACGPTAAPLFSETPGVTRVIAMNKRSMGWHWLVLWRQVCLDYWDLVVDLRASALAYCLLAGQRMVWRARAGMEHRLVTLARFADLETLPAPRLWPGKEHELEAARLLPEGSVIALGPTANWAGKQWPGKNFAELVKRLTAADGILPGAAIVIFGAASERTAAAATLDAMPREQVVDLVGKVDLLTAAAILARADLYIGNDSGLMHIAAVSGAPTLGLFGPSREAHYAPWGPRAEVVRTVRGYDELVGSPGYDHRTVGSLMESLSVDMAESAALELWARVSGEN